jgi:hypothetical protein
MSGEATHLSCTLNSSSISSSSQLSSHSLSPPDLAAPGAAPARWARSVSESSQSVDSEVDECYSMIMRGRGKRKGMPAAGNSSNSSSSSSTPMCEVAVLLSFSVSFSLLSVFVSACFGLDSSDGLDVDGEDMIGLLTSSEEMRQ